MTTNTTAANALHDAIMNLPSRLREHEPYEAAESAAYLQGYREAKKDAAELVAASAATVPATDDVPEYELHQDDMMVAGASGKNAWLDIKHYAAQYMQDGPVEIYQVTRRKVTGHAPVEPVQAQPVAWAAFADNGNIRVWTSAPGEVRKLAESVGMSLVPLYAAPLPVPAHPAPVAVESMMAECMDMVRQELMDAGIIAKSVPPMMVADAVINFIVKDRATRLATNSAPDGGKAR